MEENKNPLFEMQNDFIEIITKHDLRDKDFAMTYMNGSIMLVDLSNETVKQTLDAARAAISQNVVMEETEETSEE